MARGPGRSAVAANGLSREHFASTVLHSLTDLGKGETRMSNYVKLAEETGDRYLAALEQTLEKEAAEKRSHR